MYVIRGKKKTNTEKQQRQESKSDETGMAERQIRG